MIDTAVQHLRMPRDIQYLIYSVRLSVHEDVTPRRVNPPLQLLLPQNLRVGSRGTQYPLSGYIGISLGVINTAAETLSTDACCTRMMTQ
jgi:hypothetical protein